jgi:hypothetical protein
MGNPGFGDAALRDSYQELAAITSSGAGHPDEPTWERLAHGELDAGDRDTVFDHITSCRRCSDVWQGVLALKAEAEAAGLVHRPRGPALRWMTAPAVGLALAASLIAAVGGVVWFGQPTLQPRSAPVAVTPASPSVAPPAWLAAFPLSKADIHVTAEEAFTVRGAPATTTDPSTVALADALEPYQRDDFIEAAARLARLSREFPGATRPALYLGVSLLQLNRAAEAIEPLRVATGSTQAEVAADARWYLAVALARAGQPDAAAREVRTLCDSGGTAAARACAALKALDEPRR